MCLGPETTCHFIEAQSNEASAGPSLGQDCTVNDLSFLRGWQSLHSIRIQNSDCSFCAVPTSQCLERLSLLLLSTLAELGVGNEQGADQVVDPEEGDNRCDNSKNRYEGELYKTEDGKILMHEII